MNSPASGQSTTLEDLRVYWRVWGAAILLAAFSASFRLASLSEWKRQPQDHFVNGTPLMSTADAYYSLRLAAQVSSGEFVAHQPDPVRHYQRLGPPPEASEYWPGDAEYTWQAQRAPRRLPLLSALLAMTSKVFGSVEMAGVYLPAILSGFFAVPLCLYAARIGKPVAGLFAALVGTLAPSYLARSGVGYVDTDCLNLFFPWLASLVILGVAPHSTTRRLFLNAAMLGLVLYAYFRWYEKPALSLLYWLTFTVHLAVQRRRLSEIAMALCICLGCSHPIQLAACLQNISALLRRYLLRDLPPDADSIFSQWFPDTLDTVQEQLSAGWWADLQGIAFFPPVAIAGLCGLLWFGSRHWRQILPLAPLIAIAMLTFVSGPRFSFYLAPLSALGIAVVIPTLCKRLLAARESVTNTPAGHPRMAAVLQATVFGIALWAFVRPEALRVPITNSAIPPSLMQSLVKAADVIPPGALVWTWWDYGFALSHVFGFAVFHDGGAQYTPQTPIIAYSLMHDDSRVLPGLMDFVAARGNRGLVELANSAGSRQAMLDSVSGIRARDHGPPKYLLLTRSMLDQASALRYVAGMSTVSKDGAPLYFEPLPCTRLDGQSLECGSFSVDLATGRFSDGRSVAQTVVVDNGRIARQQKYAHDATSTLEIVMDEARTIWTFLVPKPLFDSNFNRLFVLGEFDPTVFEEVFSVPFELRVYCQKN